MSLQKQDSESASLKRKPKLYTQRKLLFLTVMLLVLLILQRALTTPTPALAANFQAEIVRQRATLPPEWTATFTLSPATGTVQTPLPTLTLGGQSSTAVPLSATSSLNTGKQVIVDVDFLALRTGASEKASIIEKAPRGSLKTILTETKGSSDNVTWYYVEDGYGWIPSALDGAPTIRDYSPQALNQMIAEMDNRLKTEPQNPTLKLQKGWMYYSQQKYDEAAVEISAAIAAMESATDADRTETAHLYDYRGHVYLDQEDYQNAAKDVGQAITLGLHEAAVYDRRAIAFQHLQEYDQSRADYEEAIRLDSKYGLLYSNLGSLLDSIYKQNPEQVDYFTKAIEVDPYFPYGYSNRANYYRQSGDIGDHVIEDFTIALRLVPHDQSALLNRGVVYWLRRELTLALKDFSLVIQLYPNDVSAYSNRGGVYAEMGNTQAAIKDLRMAVKIGDTSGLAYYNLGVVLNQQGQYAAALYCYNKALEINPYRNDARINRDNVLQTVVGLNEDQIMSYSSFELLITPTP
jgi:tetratricopeptide (TPR) repeat protein